MYDKWDLELFGKNVGECNQVLQSNAIVSTYLQEIYEASDMEPIRIVTVFTCGWR